MELADIYQIDWAEVANEINITNGHAARMRFSRFKQHMEGAVPSTRKPRETHQQKKVKTQKKSKREEGGNDAKSKVKAEGSAGDEAVSGEGGDRDMDEGMAMKNEEGVTIKQEGYVKDEFSIKEEAMDEEVPEHRFAGFGISDASFEVFSAQSGADDMKL